MYIKSPHWSSWHLLRTWTRVPGRAITECGRGTTSTVEFRGTGNPEGKTCERCYYIAAAHQTRQRGEE